MSGLRPAGAFPVAMPPGPGDEVSLETWDKRAETIDSRRDDLNKDQWRLVRDHVHMNVREVAKINRQLEAMKSAHSQLASATAECDRKLSEELRREIANLKNDLEEEKSQRATKLTSIERLLVALTEKFSENEAADETYREKLELNVAGLRREAKEKHEMMMDKVSALEAALGPGHQKLQASVNQQLDALREMQETHKAATLDAVALEKSQREQAWNDLRQHLHLRLGEEKSARETHANDLQERLEAESAHREKHMQNTSDILNAERALREKQLAAFQDAHENSRANEKLEREKMHGLFRTLFDREKQARDAYHGSIQSRLDEERATRESHAEDVLRALEAHRREHHKTLHEELGKERSLRDSAHGELRELIDGHHGKFTSLLDQESAARAAHLEDSLGKALGKEGAEREKMMQELFDKCRAEGDSILKDRIEREFSERESCIAMLRGLLEAETVAREEEEKRIEYIEAVIGGGYPTDPDCKRLTTLQSHLDALRKKLEEEIMLEGDTREKALQNGLGEERQAREVLDRSVMESFRKERLDRDGKIKDEIASFRSSLIATLQKL